MFTGLVEGRGTLAGIEDLGNAVRLAVRLSENMLEGENHVGESVCINGCCLTVVGIDGDILLFDAGPETLKKTNLGSLKVGDSVNLERALPVDGRLGGHFVQGHIDGVGSVVEIQEDGEWTTIWFQANEELCELMVPKGSIAIDGISLTLVDVEANRFSVALIPHTLEVTTLGICDVGQQVNLETDILGKYTKKLLTMET